MSLDIFGIQPHQVSRDMRGYTVLFYGEPKSGKTTTASRFPKSLLIAFEKGYAAIPGVMAMPVNSWSDFLKVLRQLKDPRAKEQFETIIIDTADIAWDYCEQYICNQAGVDAIGDIPFGAGYSKLAKEFDTKLRSIVQMDFGLVLISHSQDKEFTNELGQKHNQIVPTLANKARVICARMCDIVGYSRSIDNPESGDTETYLFMRGTPRFVAGSRFAYTPDRIVFNYQNLVDAIGEAIDKQAAEFGSTGFTDTKATHNAAPIELDFDDLMLEFQNCVAVLMGESDTNKDRIGMIVEKHLGKGKKASELRRDQADLLDIIIYELKELSNVLK